MAETKAVVGPLPVWRAVDGTRLTVDVPQSTMDHRYPLCTRHHTGCWCWEAERNETLAEYRGMWQQAVNAAGEVLAGHRTFPESYRLVKVYEPENARTVWEYQWDEDACCSCTGCQIARKAYLR